jgi:hypothetical protein
MDRLCRTSPVRDSSRDSSVMAGWHQQTGKRGRPIRTSPVSPPMVPTTPESVTMPSPDAAQPPSFRRERPRSRGRRPQQARSRATRALRASQYLGRVLWRRWGGSHRRSRVETRMRRVKPLGQRLMARDFNRQVAEFQVLVAVLNRFTAPGIPVTKVVEQVRPGEGEVRPSADLCNKAKRLAMFSVVRAG